MSRQQYFHAVPHVAPLGMMVGALRQQRHLGHEAERLGEIGEDNRARDRVARVVIVPLGQAIERVGALGLAELFDARHVALLSPPTPLAAARARAVWPGE